MVIQFLESVAIGEIGDILGAPSEARLCQPAAGAGPGSRGEAPGTECCVDVGNAVGEAYTGR